MFLLKVDTPQFCGKVTVYIMLHNNITALTIENVLINGGVCISQKFMVCSFVHITVCLAGTKIPYYSEKLSREKTFVNFDVSCTSENFLSDCLKTRSTQ